MFFLSLSGGYIIAEQMLNPLKRLNTKMRSTSGDTLNNPILYDDTGDEISELIKNFNSMIFRLNTTFEAQKQFVQNASHELKTPLTSIQINLDAALSDPKMSRTESTELIQTARSSTFFMDKLLDNLLKLSQLDQNFKFKPQDVSKVVMSVVSQLSPQSKAKKIEIKVERPPTPVTISGNRILISRAISNILENAIKYSPKGTAVHVTVEKNKTYAVLSVRDSGPGIPKKEQRKIFERFYRVDKSRSRKTGGSGLGLAITKDIVTIHKGTISVKSEKNGSTFTVTIPAITP
jgi:signal transduction histidine kinase